MHHGTGQVTEIHLDGSMRINCASEMIPAPGQYVLAHASSSDSPLSAPVFLYDSMPAGFHAAPPLPASWVPGTRLHLRGPLGHGFVFSPSARRVALVAMGGHAARLQPVLSRGLTLNAEMVMLTERPAQDLPEAVEVQPLHALKDVCKWADFIAIDVNREDMDRLMGMLAGLEQLPVMREAQILIHTQMPCGALAECGVCAITLRHEWKMACKDGPVFAFRELIK